MAALTLFKYLIQSLDEFKCYLLFTQKFMRHSYSLEPFVITLHALYHLQQQLKQRLSILCIY